MSILLVIFQSNDVLLRIEFIVSSIFSNLFLSVLFCEPFSNLVVVDVHQSRVNPRPPIIGFVGSSHLLIEFPVLCQRVLLHDALRQQQHIPENIHS